MVLATRHLTGELDAVHVVKSVLGDSRRGVESRESFHKTKSGEWGLGHGS